MANRKPARSKTTHGTEELQRTSEQQAQALEHYTEWCRENGIPPGVAQLAAIDFIALMIAHNFPTGSESELERVQGWLRDRVKSLAGRPATTNTEVSADIPASPPVRSRSARLPRNGRRQAHRR